MSCGVITVDLWLAISIGLRSLKLQRKFVVRLPQLGEFSEKLVTLFKDSIDEQESTELTFHALGPKTTALFLDYDQNLSVMDRQVYLEYLFSIHGVSLSLSF